MTVFKSYFKIVKKYISTIILYTAIFLFFAVISTQNSSSEFSAKKPNLAIIKNDNGQLVETFSDYIEENANIIELKNNESTLKDALFFREVNMILVIPENYTKDFMDGKNPKIEMMKVPDSSSSMYSEMLLNRFLNISAAYANIGMNEDKISSLILDDLKSETNVITLKDNVEAGAKINYFYNFSNYTFLAITIFVISTIMATFNTKTIKKRNLVSKMPYKKFNFELLLGNFTLCILIWVLYVGLSFVLYPEAMLTTNGLLYCINSFCFSLMTLSLSFLFGSVIKGKEAIAAIANILSLGTSFLCGCFVPQEFLDPSLMNMVKVLPSYWFVKTNDTIATLSSYNFESLKPVLFGMLVSVVSAILFFTLTNILTKLRFKKN